LIQTTGLPQRCGKPAIGEWVIGVRTQCGSCRCNGSLILAQEIVSDGNVGQSVDLERIVGVEPYRPAQGFERFSRPAGKQKCQSEKVVGGGVVWADGERVARRSQGTVVITLEKPRCRFTDVTGGR